MERRVKSGVLRTLRKTLGGHPLVWGLIFSYGIAQAVPIPTRERVLGIAQLGVPADISHSRAYPLLEKKLENFLEKLGRTPVKRSPITLPKSQVQMLTASTQVQKQTESLTVALSEDASSLKSVHAALDQTLSAYPIHFPSAGIWQRAYVAQAAYWWQRQNKEKALEWLSRAALLHPDQKIQDSSSFAFEAQAQPKLWLAFDSQLENQPSLLNYCAVEVVVPKMPHSGNIRVNGFSFGTRRAFRLPLGGTYLFDFSHEKWSSTREMVRCQKVSKIRVELALVPKKEDFLALDSRNVSEESSSVVLIESLQDRFRFFLYTPGEALDEIPLEKPVRIAELLEDPLSATVPIQSDALKHLLEKHEGSPLSLATLSLDSPSFAGQEEHGVTTPWYRDWKVWAVAGGIVGGVIAVHLATKKSEVTGQAHGLRIEIK